MHHLKGNYMFYGISIFKLESGKYGVSCPDIPECSFEANDIEEAQDLACNNIPAAMEIFYRKKRRPIPLPSQIAEGDFPIRVPTRVQAKILLWNHMVNNRYRVADIARMLGVSQTQAQRLVDMTKDGASMEALDDAMDLLGMAFNLTTEEKA